MAIRLLHSSDWQLGKPFTRFGNDDIAAILRDARLAAVERLAQLARDSDVAAVLVAGDILESEHAQPALLRRMVHRMAAFEGPWLLLPGNHDPARPGGIWDRFARSGDCPSSLRILSMPEPVPLADGRLVVLPAPLRQKHVDSDLTAWFDEARLPAGAVKVGLAHGSVLELLPAEAQSANPIALRRAQHAGLDYLALGDWHAARQVGPRTWYSGTPEPDDFTESGIGEALVVEIEGPGAPVSVERRRVGQHVWRHHRIDLGEIADEQAIADRLDALVAGLEQPAQTVLRLDLEGTVDLATDAGLAALLERLEPKLRHLEARTEKLHTRLSDDDVASFAREPLVAEVAQALRRCDDPSALLALRLLHGTWQRLERC